jgi:hypothetical protein
MPTVYSVGRTASRGRSSRFDFDPQVRIPASACAIVAHVVAAQPRGRPASSSTGLIAAKE